MTVINESGLYSLVLTSRKAAAKRFKKWVTAEVLPALRRTGTYSICTQPDIGHVLSVAEAAIVVSQQAVQTLAPQAVAYQQLTCMDGLHTLTDTAKLCGKPRNHFLSMLEAMGWIYRPGGKGCWSAKADKIKAGYLTHKYCDIRDADGQLKHGLKSLSQIEAWQSSRSFLLALKTPCWQEMQHDTARQNARTRQAL